MSGSFLLCIIVIAFLAISAHNFYSRSPKVKKDEEFDDEDVNVSLGDLSLTASREPFKAPKVKSAAIAPQKKSDAEPVAPLRGATRIKSLPSPSDYSGYDEPTYKRMNIQLSF